jgi:probable HAF family extracellular repeat protein
MARYPWDSRLDLYWRPAEHPDQISQYRVYQNGEEIITFPANPSATNIRRQVSGLVEGESYTFKVEAQNTHGFWSDNGPGVTIVFDLDTPPSWTAGSELIAEQTTTDTVTLHWTPAEHPISVGEYRIYVDGQRDQTVWASFEADPIPTTVTLTGLCPVTTYHFQVQAVDDNYQQSTGGPETLATTQPDITPPTWPEGSFVTACEVGTTRITLYWTPAEDDVEVTGYRIYRNNVLVGVLEIPPQRCGVDPGTGGETPASMELAGMEFALTTWTVEDMVPGQSYTFRIEAGDLAGNWSADGPEVTQASLLTPPGTTIPQREDYALFRVLIPNSEGTYARGLNDAGQVTVNAFAMGSRAFFWDNGLAIDLGDLGRGRATAFAMDPHGRITGESPISASKTVGFIWDERGMRSLGYYSISHWDMPRAINAHGDVVGVSRYAPIGSGRWNRAILWRRVETEQADGAISVSYPILNLGTLGGDAFMSSWETVDSEAVDINNARQIVGTAPAPHPETESWTRRAFLWEDGAMTDLGTLGGSRQYGTSSQARAINQDGQVIGIALTAAGHYQGFFWSGGVMTSLGTLGGNNSGPNALNDHGVVVGTADTNRRDCRGLVIRRAFRWQGGPMLDLGSLGGSSSVASAINHSGLIVGCADAFDGRSLPFLWENGTMYLIGNETWHSGHAHSINALGQILINASVIVGYEDGDPWGPHGNETGENGSSDQVPIIENRVYLATPWAIAPPVWPEDVELRVDTIGTTRLSLAWDPAEHQEGISGYRLYQDGLLIAELSAQDRAHTVSGLSADTEYHFKIEAGALNGQWSGMGPSTVATTMVAGQEDHRLTYLHGTGGTISGAGSQTVPDGGTGSEVEAQPDAGAVFHQWSDGRTDSPRLDSDVRSDITATAFFRSEGGADLDWYAEHGYAPDEGEDWTDVDNREVEGKGTTLREENIADTDPADPNSVFSVVSIEPGPPPAVIVQPFSTRRVYTLQSRASLTEGEWRDVPGQVHVPGGDVPLSDPDAEGTVYYRVLVHLSAHEGTWLTRKKTESIRQ